MHIWDIPQQEPDSQLPLKNLIEPPLAVKHPRSNEQGDLTSLDWTRDGALLAVGSYDATLRICTAAGELYYTCKQHKVSFHFEFLFHVSHGCFKGPIFATRFSKSGQWLLTASLDGSTCVWDVKSKALHAQIRCHNGI